MIKLGPGITLPDDFVTARGELLGMSGAGKSNGLAVMVEATYDIGAPFTWTDPLGAAWGARSSADGNGPGLQVPIFGGYHGDMPLHANSGALIARELYHLDASAILDLSAMNPVEQAHFVADYSDELFALHLRKKKIRSVFLDEGATLAPQRPFTEADVRSATSLWRLHTGGRAQGIGLKIATQSAAEQDKRTIKQAEIIVALRTMAPLDQKPVLDYLRTLVDKETADEIKRTLAKLKDGEAWFVAPRWLGEVKRGRFRVRRTFDSSQTPKLGEIAHEPRVLAPVEMDRLREALDVAAKKAPSSDDPVALRAQIKALQTELAKVESELKDAQANAAPPEPVIEKIEVPALSGDTLRATRDAVTALSHAARAAVSAAEALHTDLTRVEQIAGNADAQLSSFTETEHLRRDADRLAAPRRTREISSPPAGRSMTNTGVEGLKAGQVRMLQQLARCGGALTKQQLATLSDVNRNSGTFSDYLRGLVQRLYVEDGGSSVGLLSAGANAIGEKIRTTPPTTSEIVAWYSPKLKAGERRMLDLLVSAYPREIRKDTLATEARVSRTSGTFSDYTRKLSRLGLVEGADRGSRTMRASSTLFMNGGKK
jgi:hypothetical protein